MTFSVIIPTYNDHKRLAKCVRSVLTCTGDFTVEVIVVDNAEKHDKSKFEFNDPRVIVIHESTPGSYAARNRGASIAKGKYLAFTDSDCIVDSHWLTNAKNFFLNEQCDLIGGEVLIFKAPGGSEWVYTFEKHNSFPQSISIPKGHGVTANMFVKRKIFEQLGGFDADIKSGGDWEFTKRAVKQNFCLKYAEDVVVNHPSRTSIRSFFKKEKRLVAWGYVNVKSNYNHHGLRMILSHLLNSGRNVLKQARNSEYGGDKWKVLTLSVATYFFRTMVLILITTSFLRPQNLRE